MDTRGCVTWATGRVMLPIGEALVSGEIFATPYAAPAQLVPAAADAPTLDELLAKISAITALREAEPAAAA